MNRQHTKHTASLLSFTHIADGSQFLSCVAFFQQSPGVFTRIGPVVVHCEFSAHEVGSDRKQTGHEMFTPFHIFQMLAAFCFTFESCGLAESNTLCLFSKYQANSNYWMLQFILTVSKQKIFGITLDVILKKRGKSERLQCNPTGQLSRPKWMSLSLPLMGSDCQAKLSTLWKGSLQRCVSHIKKKSRSEISPEVRRCWKKKVWMWVRVGGSQARKRREASCSVVHGLWLNFWNQAMVCYTLLYFCQAHTGDQLSYKWMDRWNVFTAYFDWNQYYQSNRKINHL